MKLIIQGGRIPHKVSEDTALDKLLLEISNGLKKKVENTGELAEIIEEVYITHAEFSFQFKVKDMEELQEITVNHHGEPELLTVVVDIDKDGNIAEVNDNEKESLYTEKMVKMMTGNLQKEFFEIDSNINIDDLIKQEEIYCNGFKMVFYTDPMDDSACWHQYYQESEFDGEYKLIQEIKYKYLEGETFETMIGKFNRITGKE